MKTLYQKKEDCLLLLAYASLKQWNESKGRDSTLMQGIIPLALAGVLLGLPSMLKVAKDTTTDGSLTGTTLTTGGSIRTIN